ncbi:MAG: hypothetical protein ACE362_05190 [Phaeodactylibacter xiamenensis]|uniref:Glycosyltransferase RgtA/B/C/D-like domain-containing protein n=1 Tax=Phaeodactylibacter xiamenensis TaxID=1524460 RepID=A0A098RZP1_9BACT|nr:hypothetical protein [Phaeodactylibacter xiamenensis]KGE85624.1 hypothetical protein IX84_26400 [Phaeodactylibacter xiamenensis]MCR9052372.1 hypothetical protein [bacterium]
MHNREKSSCWFFAGLWVTILLTAVYWHFAGRDFSAFILLSDNNIEQVAFNEEVKVYPHDGYDGQFFYALALHPFERITATFNPPSENSLDRPFASGIRIDNPVLRTKRIGYPLLAWAANGFGQGGYLPFALVLINILGIGLAIGICFLLTMLFKAPSYYCLMPLAFIGTWICLFRDLSDHLGVAFGLLSLYFVVKKRFWAFALMGTAAMLTKETVIFILLGSAFSIGLSALRQKQYERIMLLSFPFLAYLGWSAFLGWHTPSDGTLLKHFDWPFAGIARGYIKALPLPLFWLGTFVPIALISLEGLLELWKNRLHSLFQPVTLIFLFNLAFVLLLSKAIYEDPFSFARNMLPLQYAAMLLLIQQKQGVSWFTIVVSTGTATLFYFASILNL